MPVRRLPRSRRRSRARVPRRPRRLPRRPPRRRRRRPRWSSSSPWRRRRPRSPRSRARSSPSSPPHRQPRQKRRPLSTVVTGRARRQDRVLARVRPRRPSPSSSPSSSSPPPGSSLPRTPRARVARAVPRVARVQARGRTGPARIDRAPTGRATAATVVAVPVAAVLARRPRRCPAGLVRRPRAVVARRVLATTRSRRRPACRVRPTVALRATATPRVPSAATVPTAVTVRSAETALPAVAAPVREFPAFRGPTRA